MKKISMIIIIALVLGGMKGYSFWQESLANAALTAVTSEKLKHKIELSRLKKSHAKKIAKLKRRHQKKLAKVKARERAKAKIQRTLSAMPFMGIAAFGLFEKLEYDTWKNEHPAGTFEAYTNEIAFEMNEVLQEEYQEYYESYQKFLSTYEKKHNHTNL
ncbi:hypothetical protein MN086_05005 [Sulfurovum sp. XGS-02]|uniref:hypothetical protein n=1 Tax=Sulfurovum sp. XGS-02 TaxID=2925411 RepID=UPI002051F637|nr:hypothetical protein [Sulfurovum sp. XGS-02]UPT78508.1 hypothetical protein MN086_05005 [Sulfurovum sp. XGS-02]